MCCSSWSTRLALPQGGNISPAAAAGLKGLNGDIAFIKQGPAGMESAQNEPSVYLVKIENGKVVRQ